MVYGTRILGMAMLSAVAFHGGAAGQQTGEQSLSRSLTVEQAAVYDVQPSAPPSTGAEEALRVVGWVDRPDYTYAIGENVRLFLETSQDAYVTVLNVDPSGETTRLFPNRYQPDNFVPANRAIEVGDPNSGFRIVVGGTIGIELLKVIASTRPIPMFEALRSSDAGPFQVLREEPESIARSLSVVMKDTSSPSSEPALSADTAEWAVCHQAITTIPTPSPTVQRTRSLTVQRTQESRASVACEEGVGDGAEFAPVRTREIVRGPVTPEVIVRSLSVVPAGNPDDGAEASVVLQIQFGFDSAELTSGARRDLDQVVAALADPQLAEVPVMVEGHTDAVGEEQYNRSLSLRRAQAVMSYLSQHGVASPRLTGAGFGEDRLLTDYEPTDSRQRRVEIVRSW